MELNSNSHKRLIFLYYKLQYGGRDKMKNHSVLSKIGVAVCVIEMILVFFNLFTGLINPKMTFGASIICISSLIIVIYYIIFGLNSKKTKDEAFS